MTITPAALAGPELRQRTASIELYVIPRSIMTRTAIKPDDIETFSRVKHRTLTEAADLDAFFAAIRASNPKAGTTVTEFRVKAVLVDGTGSALTSLCASALVPAGLLGEDQVIAFESTALAAFAAGAVEPSAV